jgi:peptidyl-prolyl cis-trans isomerase D
MSIIQRIREKYAAVSIAVIALSLVGFILTDYFSGKNSGRSSQPTEIGDVNGTAIDINDFDAKLNEMENGYRQQGMDVNDEMRQQIIEMLWNNEIEETLLNSEYEKLGITFTSADLNNALYGDNPPPVLAQQFKDQQTGAYDASAARQYINSMRKKKANDPQRQYIEKNLIDYIIKGGMRTKYGALLAGSVFYPKWLSDKETNDQNSIASVSYVAIPYSTISDSSVKVSDEDINAYVRKHKNEFKQEESRVISYILFDAAPTAADSAVAREAVNKQKQAFYESKDAAQFTVANNSGTPFFDGFVVKSNLQVPNADSIRNLPVGAVFGPYIDGGSYTLAKMLEKREMPDSVKFRHILIVTKNQNGQEILPDSIGKIKIDSIAGAIAKGGDFKILAAQFSADPNTKDKGGEYEFSSQQFSSIVQSFTKPVADFVFYDAKGSKKVIKTDFGYFYIEVLEQKKIEPAYKIAYFSKAVEASDETTNAASTAAALFAAESRNAKQFEAATAKNKLSPRIAEVRPTDYSIIGIGSARSLVKWVYENKTGNVSEPTSLGDKFIVALITEEKEEGLPDAKSARAQVEGIIRNQKKAKDIISKIGNNRDLNAIATSFQTNVLRADSIGFQAPFIPGIGIEPKVSGAAFNPELKGKAGEPVAGGSAVFVIRTENVSLKPSAGADYSLRRMQMEQNMKQSAGGASVQALRKAAKIKDRRIKFY